MPISVIAGLGNPGPEYRNTRHNIGFDIIDRLVAGYGGHWSSEAHCESEVAKVFHNERELILLKPQTFMNLSGRALGAAFRYWKLEADSLLVIHDDITLELARTKLSVRGSAGGHNGIADLFESIGSGIIRYRVGIGPKPFKDMDLSDYVLSKFSKKEQSILADRASVFQDQIHLILNEGFESAMNTINQRIAIQHERNG